MTLNKKDTKRILKEFHRWQNISGMDEVIFNDDYILVVNEPPNHLTELRDWRSESGEQVNRVKKVVNTIDSERLREILIRRYLVRRVVSVGEIIEELGLKKSRYYVLHNKALEYFGKIYQE